MEVTSIATRIAAVGALALLIVACGGDAATPAPTPEPTPEAAAIVVEASEFKFEPVNEWEIPASGATTFELVNVGIVEHDFTIDELEFKIEVAIGATAQGTLVDPAPGTYKVHCTVPGHEAAGMQGTLVVTA